MYTSRDALVSRKEEWEIDSMSVSWKTFDRDGTLKHMPGFEM